MSVEWIMRWFRRTASSVDEPVGQPSPAAPPNPNTAAAGDVEQESSTNAQMEGAADEPWPGNT